MLWLWNAMAMKLRANRKTEPSATRRLPIRSASQAAVGRVKMLASIRVVRPPWTIGVDQPNVLLSGSTKMPAV